MTALFLKIVCPLLLAGFTVWWWVTMMLAYTHKLGIVLPH